MVMNVGSNLVYVCLGAYHPVDGKINKILPMDFPERDAMGGRTGGRWMMTLLTANISRGSGFVAATGNSDKGGQQQRLRRTTKVAEGGRVTTRKGGNDVKTGGPSSFS